MASEFRIRPYRSGDEQQVVALWRRCGLSVPWNDPQEDIARKIAIQPELFLVGTLAGIPVATVMAGFDGHRGWINYLAVSPQQQGRGFGRQMMAGAESRLASLGCPKINLQIRSANSAVVAFYANLGYVIDEVVSMGKRL
ncbi:MAG: GNAT family acetyltransferase [Trueperaceae bacterium]